MLKKIDLSEFKESELQVNQLLAMKGGCGATASGSNSTMCTGSDHDGNSLDSD